MKIALMSDLHREFERGPVTGTEWATFVKQRADTLHHPRIGPMIDNAVGADSMILAGDIDVGTRGVAYADEVAQYLERGEISPEELNRENGFFSALPLHRFRITAIGGAPIEKLKKR